MSPGPSASRSRWPSVSHLDRDEHDLDEKPTRSKRSKANPYPTGPAHHQSAAGPRTDGDAGSKEARKLARMLRNRSTYDLPEAVLTGADGNAADAAQASRDRKKEHTHHLEQRVAELEAMLQGAPAPLASKAPPSASRRRAQRSVSVISTTSVPPWNGPSPELVVDLEEENDQLRAQLHIEQLESARLRSRLESLEDKFARLETFMSMPLGAELAAASDPRDDQSSLCAVSPTPSFEPTFAFDPDEDRKPTAEALLMAARSPTMTDSSRLVAREVELSLQRKLSHSSLIRRRSRPSRTRRRPRFRASMT
mgnify:CR=1 FL=1